MCLFGLRHELNWKMGVGIYIPNKRRQLWEKEDDEISAWMFFIWCLLCQPVKVWIGLTWQSTSTTED